MDATEAFPLDGGCTCRAVRYRMLTKPLIVHCCHCTWCQRETGSAFALNAMIESDRVALLQGEPENIDTPSNSGKGQKIARCPECHVAVWSHYSGLGDLTRFMRVGTLDQAFRLAPDVHIFTSTKQPWVNLGNAPAVLEYYNREQIWSQESLQRRAAMLANRTPR
jgi:hypothetical protein